MFVFGQAEQGRGVSEKTTDGRVAPVALQRGQVKKRCVFLELLFRKPIHIMNFHSAKGASAR